MTQILPYDYPKTITYEGTRIKYSDITEMGQGGPEIGRLLIDEVNHFPEYRFSGPFLLHTKFLYIPVFFRKWLGIAFRLGRIDLHTFKIELFGKKENLILIQEIKDGELFYFTHINNTTVKSIKVD